MGGNNGEKKCKNVMVESDVQGKFSCGERKEGCGNVEGE